MRKAALSTGKNIKLHDPVEVISDHIYSCKFYFEMESLLFIAKTFRPNRVIDIGLILEIIRCSFQENWGSILMPLSL